MIGWLGAATGLDTYSMAWCVSAVFLAAAIRGFSGFGLSALLVTSMSLILPPAEIVPVTLILEAMASLAMYPSIRKDMDWKIMAGLLAGAVPALPVGAWLLATLADATTRVVLSILVMGASLAVWRGFTFRTAPGPAANVAVGAVSGAMFGIAAIGGLPVVIYLLVSARAASTTRAILALHLMLMGLYGAGVTGALGLLTMESGWRIVLFAPALLAGVILGSKHFRGTSQFAWKRATLVLLMVLAVMGLARAVAA